MKNMIMTAIEHIDFARAHPFIFSVSPNDFSESDVQFIEKWGSWLEALARKELMPITPKQEQFVKEVNSREAPSMDEVKLWKRYLRRVIEEKDESGVLKAPPLTLDDNPIGSREAFKSMRKGQFITISKEHRK
jgi:uncharacterized protein YifE (UPF0438 family)